jgi:hypothetical protein
MVAVGDFWIAGVAGRFTVAGREIADIGATADTRTY